ncbi:MAG: glyoxylate/hydroxypyruvate reductase A [Paracoccaceae bacterium]|jgi:glyoxylate/hydroxypyruvate reductase A
MKPIVPIVHSLTDDKARAWSKALQIAAPEVDLRSLPDISESERRNVVVAIVANPDPAQLASFPNLKWVQSLWAGVERILNELPDEGVQIVRMIDPQLGDAMAEAVLAWTLYLHRSMPKYAAQQTEQVWLQHDLVTAAERSVGILGLGHLGLKSAERLQQNGFNVLGWSRSAKDLPGITTFNGPNGLAPFAAQSDIIVVLLPSTPQTRGLVGQQFIENMKTGASLINFARGDIVAVDALTEGLETRQIEHAVLDVFAVEPLPKEDPLWGNPHVTILPHISAPTNKRTASAVVAKNIVEYFTTRKIPVTVSRRDGY